jgi:hypothetical protein
MSNHTGSSTFTVTDEVENAVDEILPEGYDAVHLFKQADVWVSVEQMHYDYLRVGVDFKRLKETTDYDGSVNPP